MADEVDALTWITSRYGKPVTAQRSVLFNGQALVSLWVAAVRTYNSIAIAAGPTEEDALEALKMDLRGELKLIDIPVL